MLRKLRVVGVLVSGLVLGACGGGGGGESPADIGARLSAAPVAIVDISKCDKPGSAYHLEGGQCIARFPGIEMPPAAQAQAQAAQKQGAEKQAAQIPLATPTPGALFSWVSGAYSSLFYGGYSDGSTYVGFPFNGTFQYRNFASGNIIGVLGTSVYVYGWASNYTIFYVGELVDFSCSVYTCGGGGGGGSGLTVGGSVSSAFYTSGGYVDHTVYLYAGTSYTFNLVGGTLGDPYLQLYNPSGGYVTYDDDSGEGLNARIVTTAAYTGYYTLRASSYTSGTGSYTLSAAYTSGSGGGGGGGTTGSAITPGSYATGGFYTSYGYVDHSIYLNAGSTYTFSLIGSSLADPYLELFGTSGSLVTSDDDSGDGFNSLITYTATSTGYHTLRASSYTSGYGSYTLYASSAASGGGGGGGSGSYITWTNSDNGVRVVDANNEFFRFESGSRCLYSENMNQTTGNFCLYAGSANGNFAGQAVQVMLVAAIGGGCIAALADPYGYQIDIYTNGGIQTVTATSSMYNTAGCTY